MVIIDPYVGYDITPSSTGFFSIMATGTPFSLRSYLCGTDVFQTLSTGTYINIPYYLPYGECIQLYNQGNVTTNVDYTVSTNSPATTLLAISISVWILLLLFSYITILFCAAGGTRCITSNWSRWKEIWRGPPQVSTYTPPPPNAPVYQV